MSSVARVSEDFAALEDFVAVVGFEVVLDLTTVFAVVASFAAVAEFAAVDDLVGFKLRPRSSEDPGSGSWSGPVIKVIN